MEIEKTYTLYKIEASYGKRKLAYNSSTWLATYFYDDKVVDCITLTVDRYWKALHKYHHSKSIPEIIAPQTLTVKESR